MTTERLQKILAAAGYGSRRACEDYILARRVRVNGKVAELGAKADLAVDAITVDGDPLKAESPTYIMINKPRGVVSSLNAQGDRQTVRDLVPVPGRLYPVGRLDAMSEGLILLTNDGDLTNLLTHPRYGHEKEYKVLVMGQVRDDAIDAWRRGVVIYDEDGKPERTAPAKVTVDRSSKAGEGTWIWVVMREGKKHQIRRIGEALGMSVARIIRVRMGTLKLGNLRLGEWRELTAVEVRSLKSARQSPKAAKPKRPRR